MAQRSGRTVMASTVFLDIVGYSKTPISQQTAMKNALNDVTAHAVEPVAESERLMIDTGDGAALCFFGDPEDALFAAMAVNDQVRTGAAAVPLLLRIGIHLGPVKIMMDVNGRPNVIGDGINFAERIMSFAGDGEILVSRAFYEVVSRLDAANEALFHYLGVKRDKHVNEHQVYAVSPGVPRRAAVQPDGAADAEVIRAATKPAAAAAPAAEPAKPSPLAGIASDLFDAEEQRLAKYIGPLAGVVIKRAARSAQSIDELYQTIASAIADKADRADYLAGALLKDEMTGGAAKAETQPAASATAADTGGKPTADDLARVERELVRHIGPLAAVLVRKTATRADTLGALYRQLAVHITNDADRRAFLKQYEDQT